MAISREACYRTYTFMYRDYGMCQEILDFEHFKQHQLVAVCFVTGRIDAHINTKIAGNKCLKPNVGSLNPDGYTRLWCSKRLRMKHRLLYWLFHEELPEEVDHFDRQRSNNSISNLRPSVRKENTKGNHVGRTFKQMKAETVHELAKDWVSGEFSITQLAKKYGRSRTLVKGILIKKYWSHVTDQYFQEPSETIERRRETI